jgi:hypothetical protein
MLGGDAGATFTGVTALGLDTTDRKHGLAGDADHGSTQRDGETPAASGTPMARTVSAVL